MIEAASHESANQLCSALSDFDAELVEDGGTYRVSVELGQDDPRMVSVLDAIEGYVNARADGPATVLLNGRNYTFHEAE